jgi:hypothetical protein
VQHSHARGSVRCGYPNMGTARAGSALMVALVADVPNNESMAAISLAIAAGGAVKSAKTTVLMTGPEAVAGMKKAEAVAKVYKPSR